MTFRPDRGSIAAILKVGIPSTLVQILTSFVSVAINSILFAFSKTAVAIYGVCVKIQNIVTVGVHGINNGMIPIVAYNYGAGKPKRIDEALKWALIYSALFYLVFFAVLMAVPGAVLKIFDASDSMLAMGIPALRIFAIAWFVTIPNQVIASLLQGLSLGTRSMVLTMMRQAVFPVLLAFAAKGFGVLNVIWLSFVLAECLGFPIALFFWKRARVRFLGGSNA